jgi:hypothetical protein
VTEPRDERLARHLGDYNVAPDVPREAIWVGIRDARRRPHASRAARLGRWAAAAMILFGGGLGVGLALGRSKPAFSQQEILEARLHAHLAAADSLITLIRLDATAVHLRPDVAHRAQSLLAATRALEESTAVKGNLGGLLRDLDLVLEQVVQYSEGTAVSPREAEYIQDAITERRLPSSLRAALEAESAGARP